jgi:pimeloyl-ACP methyl ester carboxylesterase
MFLSALLLGIIALEAVLFVLTGGFLVKLGVSVPVSLAVCIGAALLWRTLAVLTTFALSGAFSRRLQAPPLWKTILSELWITLYLYTFAQVFVPLFQKLASTMFTNTTSSQPCGPVVILVHGFVCNAGMWGSMRQHLRRAGYSRSYAVNLDPFYQSMAKSLAQFDLELTQILQRENVREAIVIGHSMGGVLARVFQNQHPEKVLAAISIGAPHGGTDLARLVSTINAGPARPDSRWLVEFNAAISAETDVKNLPALNIWSDRDNIVYPQGNAKLNSTVDRGLNGYGHLHLVFAASALNLVTEFLQDLGYSNEP